MIRALFLHSARAKAAAFAGAAGLAVVGGVVLFAWSHGGGASCGSTDVRYIETAPSSVPPAITLSLDDALKRATADAGFRVTAPCRLPGSNLVIEAVAVSHRPNSLGTAAEVSIIPPDTPRENGNIMDPSPWIRIDESQQEPRLAESDAIGSIRGNEVRYYAHAERSGVVRIVLAGGPTPTPAATDIPDSDLAVYSVRGPRSWLLVQASGHPGSLPSQAEMLAMLESMFE